MGIYKPQSQFMVPNNNTINNAIDNYFVTKISGDYCSGYIWSIPTIGTTAITGVVLNQVVNVLTPLYNGDNLNIKLPKLSFNATALRKYLNNSLFWNITILGKQKSITANTNVTTGTIVETEITIPNGNFKTGDYVYLVQDSTPAGNYYYIGSLGDSKYKLYDTREKAMAMLITADYKAVSFTNGALVNKLFYACAKSDDIPFKIINVGTFTLTPTTLNKFYNTFVPAYTQENDININNYQATLYNSDDEILEQSDVIYSSDVKYFTNALFSGSEYYMRFTATNSIGWSYDTGKVLFKVNYKSPDVNAPLLATSNCDDTTIDLLWRYLVSISGTLSCGDYVENFLWEGNMGLQLCPQATLTYLLDEKPIIMNEKINGEVKNSTPTFVWQPVNLTWTGVIMKVSSRVSGDYASIGYDGTCITLDINGMTARTQFLTLEIDPKTKKPFAYLIGFRGSETAVHKFMADSTLLITTIRYYTEIKATDTTVTMVTNVESFVGVVRFEYYLNGIKRAVNETSDMTNYYTITGLERMTEYETYVIVEDKIGNRVKSDTVIVRTLSENPIIKSISASTLGSSFATLHVNTSSDRPIILYHMDYNSKHLEQFTKTFEITGLETDVEVMSQFLVYDTVLNKSDVFTYYFTPIGLELSIESYEFINIQATSISMEVKYIAIAGLDRFEWLFNGEVLDTSNASIHTVTGLKSDTNYILNIRMFDKLGNYVTTEDIPFKTDSLPPIIHSVDVYDITNKGASFDVDTESKVGIKTYDVVNNK